MRYRPYAPANRHITISLELGTARVCVICVCTPRRMIQEGLSDDARGCMDNTRYLTSIDARFSRADHLQVASAFVHQRISTCLYTISGERRRGTYIVLAHCLRMRLSLNRLPSRRICAREGKPKESVRHRLTTCNRDCGVQQNRTPIALAKDHP